MYGGRYELEAVPPDDCLHVVRVCPYGVEVVVGVYGEVCVVTDEASAELVARVDRVRSDRLGRAGC